MTYHAITENRQFTQTDGRETNSNEVTKATMGNQQGLIPTQGELMVQLNDDANQTIPATRILDLALLILSTNAHFMEAYKLPDLYEANQPTVAKLALQGTSYPVEIALDNPTIKTDIQFFYNQLQSDGELLGERYRLLKEELQKLGY